MRGREGAFLSKILSFPKEREAPCPRALWRALGLYKPSLSKGEMWEGSWRHGRATPRDSRFVRFLRPGIWGVFGGGSAGSWIPLLSHLSADYFLRVGQERQFGCKDDATACIVQDAYCSLSMRRLLSWASPSMHMKIHFVISGRKYV